MGIHGQRVSIITDNLLLINPFKTCILFLDMHTFVCVSVCLSVCGYVYICMCTYVWIMAKDIEKTSDSLDLEPYSWKMPDVGVRNQTLVSGGKGNAIKFYSWPNYNHLYADNSWDSSKFLHFSSTKILKKRTWDSPLEIKKKRFYDDQCSRKTSPPKSKSYKKGSCWNGVVKYKMANAIFPSTSAVRRNILYYKQSQINT